MGAAPPDPSQSLYREADGEINATEDSRRFELSFSSEAPYRRWFGDEVLDHSPGAVDLSRLQEIGVVLFNHDRNRVLGRVERAWIDGLRGKATVLFDDDSAADEIRQKVASGTLRGVSVGYQVKSWETLREGQTSGRFTGPCDVAREWEPYEISIVSVPADASVGVGRKLDDVAPVALALAERQLRINRNRGG